MFGEAERRAVEAWKIKYIKKMRAGRNGAVYLGIWRKGGRVGCMVGYEYGI